ncbi:hypothetical protein [Bradyrhizobium roseum]|uniref:hypothetical protein n=1 Tax=Bradyrhizobium roseum TaxID=3056648 RepID=UPI002A4E1FE4|nr:hypothetical protein [Bradyrhizobium roseus]
MVLDAVARIEQNLAAQREEELEREANLQREEGLSAQQAKDAVAAAAAAQDRLTEALAAIRSLVEAAEESAMEALDSLALEKRMAPVRKGARVLREIAWRLREIGNDGRICDLIDSQVTVIEKSTDQFSSDEARLALRAAFAALQGRLVEFTDDDASMEMETEAAAPAPAAPALDLVAEIAEAFFAREAAKASSVYKAPPADKAPPVAPRVHAEPAPTETPQPAAVAAVAEAAAPETAFQNADAQDADETTTGTTDTNAADADAQDEAVLDMIAMEMGAPDPIGDDEIEIAEAVAEQARPPEPAPTEPVPVAPTIVAKAPEPVFVAPPVQQVVQAPPSPPAPVPAPAVEMSLGSSLIASGLLKKPITAANDPLAPIRRMSQAEKIAFFS